MKFNSAVLSTLPGSELLSTDVGQYLLCIIQELQQTVEELNAEIRLLKGHSPKPAIAPSRMEKASQVSVKRKGDKRAGSAKAQKTKNLTIHHEKIVEAEGVQNGWIFKGYTDFIVQDLKIEAVNTRYLLKKYLTPEGNYVSAEPPKELKGRHFGIDLQRHILYQYHQCHVTQPLLLEELIEREIDISSGQLNNLLTEDKEVFHREKEDLLATGLAVSPYIQTDDTGARHDGANGYCTVLCNEHFTYFSSGERKSRINFLEILRTTRHEDYRIDALALEYMEKQGLPSKYHMQIATTSMNVFRDKLEFEKYLAALNITAEYVIRIITEGALLGSIMAHGINKEIAIISDDAGQFNIFQHGLCWIHAERIIRKVHCFTEDQKIILDSKCTELWNLYSGLKAYKTNAVKSKKDELNKAFDSVFSNTTGFLMLDKTLERIGKNKTELLLVLERPEIPIHNNTSERDIREYVKKRKISGSTRSEEGRRCRDTFASLKKTCRKLNVSYWHYLDDRLRNKNTIPQLSDLIFTE